MARLWRRPERKMRLPMHIEIRKNLAALAQPRKNALDRPAAVALDDRDIARSRRRSRTKVE